MSAIQEALQPFTGFVSINKRSSGAHRFADTPHSFQEDLPTIDTGRNNKANRGRKVFQGDLVQKGAFSIGGAGWNWTTKSGFADLPLFVLVSTPFTGGYALKRRVGYDFSNI